MSGYIVLIIEFVKLKGLSFIYLLATSIAVGVAIFFCGEKITPDEIGAYLNSSLNVLGILLGFTCSVFTILVTGGNRALKKSKEKLTGEVVFKKKMTLFDELLVQYGFLIVFFGLLLIMSFLIPLFKTVFGENYRLIFTVNVSLIIFAVIQLITSILNLYFIITLREVEETETNTKDDK